MSKVIFTETGFKQYLEWQSIDRKIVKKINDLIKSIERDGLLKGIGKPETLKNKKSCSRKIDEYNRLVYNEDSNHDIIIYSCKGHYEE